MQAGESQHARSEIRANREAREAAERRPRQEREKLEKQEEEKARRKKAEEQYVKAVSTMVPPKPLGNRDFNFESELDQKKDERLTQEELKLVEKVKEAVQESNPAKLKAYLGPQRHKSKKQFQKQSYDRNQKWLKDRRESDFYLQATHLVKVFARKVTQDALWASYEKDLEARQAQEQKQPTINLVEQKSGDKGSLQHELEAYQKLKLKYEHLKNIYQEKGLKAFGEALQAQDNRDLFEFFNNRIKPGSVVLKEKDKEKLKLELQKEFRNKEVRFAGLLMAPTPERTSTSDSKLLEYKSPRSFSDRDAKAQGRESISLSSMQYQRSFFPDSPNESTALVSHASEKKEDWSKALIPMGDAQWSKNHQLVLLEHHRPKVSDLDNWLGEIDALIRRNNDLVELVFDCDELCQKRRELWTQLEEQQRQAEINLQNDQEAKTQQFEKDAHNFFAVNGNVSHNDKAEIDKVRKSKLGERSADDVCFANDGILLLHTALAQYQKKPTPEKLQVVEVLMERGASLYVLSPNDTNALGYLKANSTKGEAINNWDLTSLTFKNMPAFSHFTQEICRYLVKNYCPLRKKDSSSAWTSFWHGKFYSHDVNSDRLDDLRELAEQLWRSASTLDDTNILVWIKQKTGGRVPDDMSYVNVKATPAKGVAKSPLYQELLGFVKKVEAGKLECFRSSQGMPVAPKADVVVDIHPPARVVVV